MGCSCSKGLGALGGGGGHHGGGHHGGGGGRHGGARGGWGRGGAVYWGDDIPATAECIYPCPPGLYGCQPNCFAPVAPAAFYGVGQNEIPGALTVIPPSAVVGGTPSALITAKGNCVVSGGSWSDSDQKCTMPQPPGAPTWWSKQPDSTKVLIVGGAAAGALAIIAVALGAFRGKYKSNPPRGKRTGRGHYRYDIVWNRRTGKWKLVAGTSAQRRSWKQLGLLAKPGKAYNTAMRELGHGAERQRNYND